MAAVYIRILLRYLAPLLIAKGILSPELGSLLTNDPDVAQMIQVGAGLACGIVAEGWYVLARKFGWAK